MKHTLPPERRHWSFQKRSHPEVPSFQEPAAKAWIRNDVDKFILAGLQKEGLTPAPEANKLTLVRRLTFDITGLPPAPADIDAFLHDSSQKAYEKVVDRLLASPAFGERWGRHWLDVVRFAESDGFEYDTHRHDAWRYRDYVIQSYNSGKPYDQFIREQLAGDEIAPKNEIMRIATGFHRLGPVRKNAGNQEVSSSRNEVLTEMTNVVGSALLGVTLGCARCHDHKFDPIRHTDYYRMQAFFASTYGYDVPLSTPEEQSAWKAKNEAVTEEAKAFRKAMKGLKGEALTTMEKRVKEVEAGAPEPLPSLYSVMNEEAKTSPIFVLARGDYQNKGEQVHARPLGVLLGDNAPEWSTQTPRTDLANWILQPENPLTSRVLANRLWLYCFGRGIVATPNDFGRMGTRPTNLPLLDYLANYLVENGWSQKALLRQIFLSASYRQSSRSPIAKTAEEKDPENKLLWKHSRRRLDAEEIRDGMLAVSGALNTKAGGPSVMVPVDSELVNLLYKKSQWVVDPDKSEHNRRSVYLIAKRNLRLPFMEVFDAPDMQISCPRRDSSTHPPQALELMNGDLSNRLADALAHRLNREAGRNKAKQVDLAYRLAAGRPPSIKEKKIAAAFLRSNPPREFALAMLNRSSSCAVKRRWFTAGESPARELVHSTR